MTTFASSGPDSAFEAALVAAEEEARARGTTAIGTGHLLLGILQQRDSMAVGILAGHGITYESVSAEFAALYGKGPDQISWLPAEGEAHFAPVAAGVIRTARQESGDAPTVDHLLAALLSAKEGMSTRLLQPTPDDPEEAKPPVDLGELEREIRQAAL